MVQGILQFADLQELCKPGKRPRLRTVESWLRGIGVPYKYDGAGGCFTTQTAFDRVLGVAQPAANDDHAYNPDELF